MTETSIILPVDTNQPCVQECIDAVIKNTDNYEIIFIVDDRITFLDELRKYGRIVMVKNPFIFSERINAGIKASTADYFCILNSDTIPHKDWLRKMINTNRRLGPGLVGARTRPGGCSNRDAHNPGPAGYTSRTLNMFATLIPRRVFEVLGPLDERFIYYGGEDDDYSLRAIRHGFKLMISDGFVYHKVGGSFNTAKVRELLPKTVKVFYEKWGIDILAGDPPQSWVNIEPLVSVLMPTRDHENYIGEAIQSTLNQTHKSLELLIGVDGDGQDKTLQIVKSFIESDPRVKLFQHNSQIGSCSTRNLLFSKSKGEFIALMDSDDLMFPDRLAESLYLMAPDIDIVHSAYLEENKSGDRKPASSYPVNKNMLLNLKSFIAGGTFLMRRCVMEQAKLNEEFNRAMDFEYVLRNYDRFKFRYLDKPTLIYRRHAGKHLSGNIESMKQHKKLISGYSIKELD